MDVILNRRAAPLTAVSGCGNDICHAQSYVPEDEAPEADDKFRAVILFLPQCGVFYCSRDCHAGDAGLTGTLRAYDMSWLRLHRSESEGYSPSYTFGDDGFVRRFYSETNCLVVPVGYRRGRSRLAVCSRISRYGWCTGRGRERTRICPRSRRTSSVGWTSGMSLPTTAPTNTVIG